MATPATLRAYANLPAEVPEALLAVHLDSAVADLQRRVAILAPPPADQAIWSEAVTVRALAAAFPWLNTFALDGAAKVGRLEGTVEFRFLTPEDVAARVAALNARFDELVGVLITHLPSEGAAPVMAGGFSLNAI